MNKQEFKRRVLKAVRGKPINQRISNTIDEAKLFKLYENRPDYSCGRCVGSYLAEEFMPEIAVNLFAKYKEFKKEKTKYKECNRLIYKQKLIDTALYPFDEGEYFFIDMCNKFFKGKDHKEILRDLAGGRHPFGGIAWDDKPVHVFEEFFKTMEA